MSNAGFLLAAAYGLRVLPVKEAFFASWERRAGFLLIAAVALVAFGSGYYHLWPDNETLVWDRNWYSRA